MTDASPKPQVVHESAPPDSGTVCPGCGHPVDAAGATPPAQPDVESTDTPLSAKLVIAATNEFDLPRGQNVTVGSDERCDLRVESDVYVSRRHCEFVWDDQQLCIRDLGSSNGVWVRRRFHHLQPGDQLMIGRTVVTVASIG